MDNVEEINKQLETKYQKIASEYSKMRAQVSVLKKAVIDEQSKNNELKQQIKEKDVSLRRSEQELDSLIFRNQQLTKRITILQEELDIIQKKTKKGKNKTTISTLDDNNKEQFQSSVDHIYVEEFQRKIVENAQLLSQLTDKDIEIDELNNHIKYLENKLNIKDKEKLEMDNKYIEKIDTLEKEKNDILKKLNEYNNKNNILALNVDTIKCDYDNDYEEKKSLSCNQTIDYSSFSSPSISQRSYKSNDIKIQNIFDYNDIIDNNIELNKLKNLEKELNQYKSNYYILKIKYDELKHKDDTVIKQSEAAKPTQVDTMVGSLKAPFVLIDEIESREAKIKDYFLQEINKLIIEKEICHAKYLAIAANNEIMNIHLSTSEEKRESCEAALVEALSNWTSSQEDKEVREGNYKSQLNTMTEHLANMNEKLIQQTEEIEHLKYELNNKGNRKGKQK